MTELCRYGMHRFKEMEYGNLQHLKIIMYRCILLVLLLLFVASCDSKRVFEEYRPVDRRGWHCDSTMVFTAVLRKDIGYGMYLNVRNMGNYSNRNLWLSVSTHFPDGGLRTDTVELILADPSGRWKGSGIGDLYDYRFLYRQDMKFPLSGEYRFVIRQAMRPEMLKGIHDVGMRLEVSR